MYPKTCVIFAGKPCEAACLDSLPVSDLVMRTCNLFSGNLLNAINRDFGSVSEMQTKMSMASVGVQGSGWGWLGYNKVANRLQIVACPNQDPLEATTGDGLHLLLHTLNCLDQIL